MPNNDTPQGVDCSSLEGLYEAAMILLANSHKVATWVNGDEQMDVELGGKQTPSIRKLVALLNGIAGIATATTPGAVMPDGVTTEVDAQGKLSAIKATLESFGIVQPDGVTTMLNEAGLLSVLGGNLLLNSEELITESGEWIVPVKGWYEILAINGGAGGYIYVANKSVTGGISGAYKRAIAYFVAGQKIQITIGAGGIGQITDNPDSSLLYGGKTTVGDIDFSNYEHARLRGGMAYCWNFGAGSVAYAFGGGFGGKYAEESGAGGWYGAGGGASWNTLNTKVVSNGMQGAVYMRWHDPAKAAGQQPEPALFSARRMAAPRTAAQPATINLYDPETGHGSVWREEDAEAKLAEGMISEEAWTAICEAKAAEERAVWLADPETLPERFELLRAARDAKLAATDYLVAPDYPLSEEQRAAVIAYRQSLRDLPSEDGAPWDGGGELTPWPEMPAIEKAE